MPSPAFRVARLLFLSLLTLAASPAFAGVNRWTPRGPIGPTSSGVADLVFDPRSPSILWISSWGALYKSDDGGASVHKVATDLGSGLRIGRLAIDPARPDVLYATVGHGDARNQSVYRTLDGGVHWTQVLSGGEDFSTLWSLAVAPGEPGQPGIVFVGTYSRLFRSIDGGASFQPVITLDWDQIFDAVAPDFRNPGTIYAATRVQRLKSTDFGVTWTALAEEPAEFRPEVQDLVVAGDAQTLYESAPYGSTWRSRDGGATWEGPFEFGAEFLAVDPVDSSTVYGGSVRGLFVSHDGGETFAKATRGVPELGIDLTGYYGVYAIKTDPARPGHAFAATEKGLFATADRGNSWRALPLRGLTFTPVYNIRIDPYDPKHWILNSLETYVESHDSGRTVALFANRLQHRGTILDLQFDPFVRNRLWAMVALPHPLTSHLFVSTNGGTTWTSHGEAPWGVLLLPAPRELLILGNAIYRSTNSGHTWQVVYGNGSIGALQQDPRNPRAIYGSGLRSTNAGRTWHPWGRFDAIGFDPFRPRTVHIARGDTLLITRDDGASFQVVGHFGLEEYPLVRELLFDRVRPHVLYAVTYLDGLLRSRDGGVTWEPINDGLPEPLNLPYYDEVSSLIQDPVHGQRFYICPAWKGLYQASFPDGPP